MERLKAKIYTIWCWTGCGLSTALWATVSIFASLFTRSGRLQHFCMCRWSKDNLWLSRARVVIDGLGNINHTRPQIFVANHSGLHDILSLSANLPIQFRWIAKKSLFNVPFMGWHMTRSGYIPIDRDNPREAARSIIEAARIIQGGVNAIAFPEGTRSKTGDLGSFHSGAFALALRTGVSLIPISLEGSYRVIMPKTLQVNPGVIIRIKIGEPLDLSPYVKSDKHRLMEEVHQIMSRNLQDLRSRKRPDEEREDAVFRWIYGKTGRPDYDFLRARES
ncbi:MAG TPA: lysophospholipid acyltransferase family protein [Acidobacteriota bacterium]|nr:lysophospholipid acyltransferase family protein [Acidobacteriota bacterium]